MRKYQLTLLFALSAILFISVATLILNHIIAESITNFLVISESQGLTEGAAETLLQEVKDRILLASVWIMLGLFLGLLGFVLMGDLIAQRANQRELSLMEEKQLAERKGLEAQLLHAQKMECIGRLAGGVAHDFNNLLIPIIGYSQLGAMETPDGHQLQSHLNEIRKAADQAANLTTQLLAFSRRETTAPKIINLNDLIIDMDKMLRRLIGEDIELVTDLAPDLGPIKADAGQIGQVLMNLVVNAHDAVLQDGLITIRTSNVTPEEAYLHQHPEGYAAPRVMFSVSDNGTGMTEEVKARIFEPFFTTKEEGKGTGLGLATCQAIVHQMGGLIEVLSKPGHGCTFNVYLPGVERPEPELVDSINNALLKGGSETVLLVEDESSVRNLVSRLLQDQGYHVLEAANGEDALAVVQEIPDQEIHLLLTDVVMPRIGGVELAEKFCARYPHAKVLFMSGYIKESRIHHISNRLGATYIQKPFLPAVLVRSVREVLDCADRQAPRDTGPQAPYAIPTRA